MHVEVRWKLDGMIILVLGHSEISIPVLRSMLVSSEFGNLNFRYSDLLHKQVRKYVFPNRYKPPDVCGRSRNVL